MIKTTLTMAAVAGAALVAGTAGYQLAQQRDAAGANLIAVAGPGEEAQDTAKKGLKRLHKQKAKQVEKAKNVAEKQYAQPEEGNTPDAQGEMEQWKKMNKPGTEHQMLLSFVGHWDAKTNFMMDPSQPAEQGTGRMKISPVFDGRFTKAEFSSQFGNEPFKGLGFNGYDNLSKKYVATWMDSTGTGIMYMTGDLSADGRVMTMVGKHMTPMGESEMKIVSTIADENHFTDEFYNLMPSGEWMKSGTIKYTRAGAQAEVQTHQPQP